MSVARGTLLAIALLLTMPWMVAAQSNPQADQDPERREGTGLYWRNRPSIQLGEHVRLDLRLKVQLDWREFDPDIAERLHDFRTRRGGVNGEVGEHVEFQIERDLNPLGRWRDVFVNWRTFRQAEVTVGRFKVPFGREQLISSTDIDFAFRSAASSIIPPARETGVMVHGRFLSRGLTYEVGVFDGDGDNGRLEEAQFQRPNTEPEGMGNSVALRVTGTPLRPLAETFETLRIGGAYGAVEVPEGLNSLRGEAMWGSDFVEPVYVNGLRQRYGFEFSYLPGPFGFVAEWMQAREERTAQGLGDIDLSDFLTTGWYASGTWMITGEDKDDFNRPRRPLFKDGMGAIEVGVRYEELSLESAEKIGPAFANPRAENFLGNADAIWTFGVNWFPNRWTRLLVNGMHETFEDPSRTPLGGQAEFWSGVFRLQFAF